MTRPPAQDQALPDVDPRDLVATRYWGHDMRGALAELTDHLRLIPRAELTPLASVHLAAALQQSLGLARMIGAALADLTGTPPPEPLTDLPSLLAELEVIYARPAARRGARLTIRRDPNLPERVMLDAVLLDRILRNLIGNALTHGGARQIDVLLHRVSPLRLGLRVQDDGSGFPQVMLAGGMVGAPHGHGLGLGIVAGLVADLGGVWGLGNRATGGAEVWVHLPYDPVAEPVLAAAAAQVRGRLAGARILAADDSATSRTLLRGLLEAEGATVDLADSGPAAVEMLNRHSYDLLIVDALMPGLSGAQVIRALRSQARAHAQAPALAMTADNSVQRLDELIAAGASRVLIKPLPDPVELLRVVERLLKSAAASTAAAAPALPAEVPPLFDPEPLLRVCALAGPTTGREILERIVVDLTETLDWLNRAGNPPDPAELRAATHVLIALAGTGGAMQLLARTQALNRQVQQGLIDDLAPKLAEIRLLTEGTIAAISRLPRPPLHPGVEAP